MRPFLTIVIPLRNEEPSRVAQTLASCKSSLCGVCHYLLLDSSDRFSLDIDSCCVMLDVLPNRIELVRLPAEGIYSALNYSLSLLRTPYVSFMNIGDRYLPSSVDRFIGLVRTDLKRRDDISVYYGDTVVFSNEEHIDGAPRHSKMKKELTLGDLVFNPPCHQSMFFDVRIFTTLGMLFDDSCFRVCADRDFFARSYLSGVFFRNLNFYASAYELGGYSSRNSLLMLNEVRLLAGAYLDFPDVLYSQFLLLKYRLSAFLKKFLNCKRF